jgi:hypothetical protein
MTVAEHTIASTARQSIGTAISKRATSRAIHDDESSSSEASGTQVQSSYDSEESGSSWEEGSACDASRDVSLLDSADTQDEDDVFAETYDDEEDEEEDSDDDDDSQDRRRRRRPTVMQILKHMKDCSLKGASVSYEDGDIEFLPDVAQISTNVSSKSSITDDTRSTRETTRGAHTRRKMFKKNEKLISDSLIRGFSAIGDELMANIKPPARSGKKGGKSSRNRRDGEQSTRIIESLRDIFSCGDPRY